MTENKKENNIMPIKPNHKNKQNENKTQQELKESIDLLKRRIKAKKK